MGCCKSKRNSNNKSGNDAYIDIENQEKQLQENLYSSVEKEDQRVKDRPEVFPQIEVHTVFGDSYLILKFFDLCS